jgi:glutathione S-transferase
MITIHGIVGSPFGRAVMIACAEKNLPHRLSRLRPGEHKQPEHLARHPFGRVPAVEDDGFWLYETQAILRYLDDAFPNPRLTPADPKKAARMNQALGILDCYFFTQSGAIGLVFNRVVAPRLGFPVDEERAKASLASASHCVEVFAGFLSQGPYLAGEAFSLADILVGSHLDMLAEAPEGAEMVAGTAIAGWLERLRSRPSFASTTWDRLEEAA